MRRMNMKQLKYVLVLAEKGSFSRAAEALNITQPSLSQYIKKIEKQQGVELFKRTNGDVQITDAGRIYIEAGKKILALEHQMENAFSDLAEFKGGTVTIGISPYRSVHLMPAVLREFDKLYPDIKLVVKEKSGRDLIEAAIHGEFDLCVIALPVDEKIFDYEVIYKESAVIAVGKATPLYSTLRLAAKTLDDRKYPAVDISALDGTDFAVLKEYMPVRILTDKIFEDYGIRVNEKIEVSSNEALLSIVESGVCASLIPSGLTNTSNGNIAFFSIKQEINLRDVAVIYRKDQYISKPISELINIFKAEC